MTLYGVPWNENKKSLIVVFPLPCSLRLRFFAFGFLVGTQISRIYFNITVCDLDLKPDGKKRSMKKKVANRGKESKS